MLTPTQDEFPSQTHSIQYITGHFRDDLCSQYLD